MKTVTVKDLQIKVTYKVGLGNVEMPENIYNELLKANENMIELDPTMLQKNYREAADWLSQNIQERDCMDWEAEVENISID